jgi:RNA polymerase sigma-70 factor (ECF subfamily)
MDLYRFAFYMLGNREDAEDAVQDAVILAFNNFSQLKNSDSFKSWLFTILSNRCKRKIRIIVRNRNVMLDSDISILADSDRTAELQDALDIYNEMDKLTYEEKLIINLSIHGGYKSQEISKIVDIPEGTVRSKLHRALHKIKNNLKEDV